MARKLRCAELRAMVRKFEVGGVYQVSNWMNGPKLAVNVTRISADRKTVRFHDSNNGTGEMGDLKFGEKKTKQDRDPRLLYR